VAPTYLAPDLNPAQITFAKTSRSSIRRASRLQITHANPTAPPMPIAQRRGPSRMEELAVFPSRSQIQGAYIEDIDWQLRCDNPLCQRVRADGGRQSRH